MNYRCDNCGSRNHQSGDCSKPYNGWREREPVQVAAPAPPPAAERTGYAKVELSPPRWRGGPPVCPEANLPAFADLKQWEAFEASNCPGGKVFFKFDCPACGHLHVVAGGFDPAGGSSGNTRTSNHYDELVAAAAWEFKRLLPPDLAAKAKRPAKDPFMRQSTVAEIERRKRAVAPASELPKQEVDRGAPLNLPKAEPKKRAPLAKIEGGLF